MSHSARRSRSRKKKKKRNSSFLPSYHFLLCIPFLTLSSYLVGNFTGRILFGDLQSCNCSETNIRRGSSLRAPSATNTIHQDELDLIDQIVSERMKAALERETPITDRPKFPPTMSLFANGMVKTSQTEFKTKYNNGTPKKFLTHSGNSEVIVLYNAYKSRSLNFKEMRGIQTLGTEEALENCDTMNVVYQNPKVGSGQCLAILRDYESYHVQRWKRINDDASTSKSSGFVPLGQMDPINASEMEETTEMLKKFLKKQNQIKLELKKRLDRTAIDRTVIVMTANFGQAELLTNFVCSSNSKGFNLSNVIVFATDTRAEKVSQGLGLETYYNQEIFESMSSKEAEHYADEAFTSMMYAKVFSVLLVNSLGFDALFQDIDVVWYKHPLAYFKDSNSTELDIIVQDDGSRSQRFSPLFANSGFYFARYNDRTQYLFTSMLYSMDIVRQSGSHQKALIALMNEHSSLYGLRVGILDEDFPGGNEFHRNKGLMMNIFEKKKIPFIFHMSWTESKVNKIKFLKQMGAWYVKDSCEGESVEEQVQSELKHSCCSLEPLVTCFYKDKPSIVPCRDSPSIDVNGRSFW